MRQAHDAHVTDLALVHLGRVADDHADGESPDPGRETARVAPEVVAKAAHDGVGTGRGAVRLESRVPRQRDRAAGRGGAQPPHGSDVVADAKPGPRLASEDDDLGVCRVGLSPGFGPAGDGHDDAPSLILGAVPQDADGPGLPDHGSLEADAVPGVDGGGDAAVPSRGLDEVRGSRDGHHRRAGEPHRARSASAKRRGRQDRCGHTRADPPRRGRGSRENA